jgi:hypothetical protein
LIQAFQASNSASSVNPGSSAQRTATQRLLAWVMGGGNGDVSGGKMPGVAGCTGTDGGTAGACVSGEGMGPLAQDASIPTIATPTTCHRRRFMGLILLEAMGALVILVLIVWWTMFSGRDKGELPPEAESDAKGDKAPKP